ncbi:YeeE/YedE family protein [Aureimonas sp. AU40]|uniref:YeeE/YedE family protein n=1 Tax=Aureimonas sp. AU40 TaxID=1637747 RepID=UPI0007866B07|nr:YeeE/YedE family protein [Aureimonas sp. AU40]
MARVLLALLSGLVFGAGLVVSQMVVPAKVLGFLDIFGAWDPSLAFVMIGAILVAAPAFALARRMERPWLGERFELPARREIDRRLLAGAVVFGIGWGLVGLCPGPALAALALAPAPALVFVAAMVAGMLLLRLMPAPRSGPSAIAPKRRAGA